MNRPTSRNRSRSAPRWTPSRAGRCVALLGATLWACSTDPDVALPEVPAGAARSDMSLPSCPAAPGSVVDGPQGDSARSAFGWLSRSESVAAGLETPWDLGFLPDGRILVTERGGRVRVIENGELRAEPWAELAVEATAEAGLLGLAIDPDFSRNGFVYVMGTFVDSSLGARIGRKIAGRFDAEAGNAWKNRILRITDSRGVGIDPVTVLTDLPVGPVHAGGALEFGPDGHLYFALGDGWEPASAQDPTSPRGRIHRIEGAGDGAASGTTTVARGLRNVQGLDWDPITGLALATEHGPTGAVHEGYRTGHDELNLIREGGNYGWPMVVGGWEGTDWISPIAEWTPAIAPGGMTFVTDRESSWFGDVIVSTLAGQRLLRIEMDRTESGAPLRAVCQEVLIDGIGRIRAVADGGDGYLYFGTSNRDQRGVPRDGDDRLLRIPIR